MKNFLGKKVYLKVHPDRIYQGIIEEVNYIGTDERGTEIYVFLLKDKFDLLIAFSNKEIKYMEEQRT